MSLAPMLYTLIKNKEDESILPVFNTITHAVDQAEARFQFAQSHALQKASHDLQSEAAQRDIERIATEAKRYADQQVQRLEDKKERKDMHMESLRHQYMIQYINGMFNKEICGYGERRYLARVRIAAIKELGIDIDSLRLENNAPKIPVYSPSPLFGHYKSGMDYSDNV
jgi:hypothetical protein